MNTALVYTLNNQSNSRSFRITAFGNPNDWILTNKVYSRVRTTIYDGFHAVAADTQTTRVYYSNNALGVVAYSPIYSNDTNYSYFFAPPISKRVSFAVVSPT